MSRFGSLLLPGCMFHQDGNSGIVTDRGCSLGLLHILLLYPMYHSDISQYCPCKDPYSYMFNFKESNYISAIFNYFVIMWKNFTNT